MTARMRRAFTMPCFSRSRHEIQRCLFSRPKSWVGGGPPFPYPVLHRNWVIDGLAVTHPRFGIYGSRSRKLAIRRSAIGAKETRDGPVRACHLLFVQVVVLVVLGTLQRELQRQAVLGDLVDIYIRGNFDRS